MATEKIYTAQARKSDGTVVLRGGGIASTNKSGTVSTISHAADPSFVTRVHENIQGEKIINSATALFANNNVKPIAKGATTYVGTAGNLNTNHELNTTGSKSVALLDMLHDSNTRRTRMLTTAIRGGFYNAAVGTFDAGYPDNILDTFGADVAGAASRAAPGKIVFSIGGNTTSQNYDAKTG